MIFIISTIPTILFMFLLYTYQTSRLWYIVKKKWNQRNFNYDCGHPSYIVIIENKSSKLYYINISKLSNSKEKILSSSHNWSFLFYCLPIFWNHPPKHHAKPTIIKGHQELQNKNLTHLPPWHYSHKRNTTSFPLPLTCIKQTIPHIDTKKKKTPLELYINYPLSCHFMLSSTFFTFHPLHVHPNKNLT